jgi:hypothetical protein
MVAQVLTPLRPLFPNPIELRWNSVGTPLELRWNSVGTPLELRWNWK